MSNKKQTAVESIIEKINNVKPTEFCSIETIKKWCIEAKAMEKEQRIEDMKKMQIIDDVDFDGNVTFIFNNIEQYYKETYE